MIDLGILRRLYARQGYHFDAGKQMWFKTRSHCHNATTEQRHKGDKPAEYTYFHVCTECKKKCHLVHFYKVRKGLWV